MSTLVLSEIIHEKQSFIACIVIVVYLLMLLALGFVGYLKSKGGEEDYYLAGRDQGWFISSLTIMATFFSSFALLGAPGMVYREGVVFALVSLNVPIAGLSIYLLGGRIWRLGRHRGYVTPADMICDYYGSKVILRLLVAMTGFLFAIPYVMMQIKAGGELSAVLFRDHEHAFEKLSQAVRFRAILLSVFVAKQKRLTRKAWSCCVNVDSKIVSSSNIQNARERKLQKTFRTMCLTK